MKFEPASPSLGGSKWVKDLLFVLIKKQKMIKVKKSKKKKNNLKKKGFFEFGKNLKKLKSKDHLKVETATFGFLIIFSLFFLTLIFAGVSIRELNRKKIPTPPSILELRIGNMVRGYPLEEMVPFIVKQNKEVAKYLVAISKKESSWGENSPQKDGRNCYNYWGYRGAYNQTDSGYSCFDSPEQAVKVVGRRIKELLKQNIKTPADMIVWKCGSSCAGHGDGNVQKWIDDVGYYYYKL